MAVFGSQVSKDIRDVLDERKRLFNYNNNNNYNNNESRLTNPEMMFAYSKTPWVAMHSCIEYREDNSTETQPREQYFLVGSKNPGIGGFENMFSQLNSDQPFRPVPGIDSIDISLEGSYGSIRKSTITMKCWTFQDLNMIESLFMNIQGSVVLQWGYSTDIGASNFVKIEDEEKEIFDNERLKQKRLDSRGSWDAFIGRVVNFTWTGNEQLGFDMTIELMSPGNSILTQKIENTEENSLGEEYKMTVIDFLQSEEWDTLLKNSSYTASPQLEVYEIDDGFLKVNDLYVTIRWLETEIISKYFSTLNYDNFNSDGVAIGAHPNLRSMNPDICILPGAKSRKKLKPVGDSSGKEIKSFYSDKFNFGYVSNILVSSKFIKECFLDSPTLIEAMNKIISEINTACLDYFELNYETPDGGNTTKLVDVKYVKKDNDEYEINENSVYMFEILQRNSIVKSYSVSSNIPDSFKTMAMISKKSDKNMFGLHILKGLYGFGSDTYNEYIDRKRNTNSDRNIKYKTTEGGIWKSVGGWFVDASKNVTFSLGLSEGTDEQKRNYVRKNARSDVRKKINQKFYYEWKKLLQNDNKAESIKYNQEINNRLIPIDLSLTIEGISGFEYGNIFTVDFLPDRYKMETDEFKIFTYFQITNIAHSINNSGWTTEITGIMRVKLIVKKSSSTGHDKEDAYRAPERNNENYESSDTWNQINEQEISSPDGGIYPPESL